jgi:hypothetical protein
MPYFKGPDCNILHIHIPKTGGTSVNYYLSEKYNIPLDEKSLYTDDIMTKKGFFNNKSLQHLTFQTLYDNNDRFKITWNDPSLQMITVVRNPYERVISDMKWWAMINFNSSKEQIYNSLSSYIKLNTIDDHNVPQYKYITYNNEKINNINVFHTEELNKNMQDYGFNDFNKKLQTTKNFEDDIINLLSIDSIDFINRHYEKDFKMFNYQML